MDLRLEVGGELQLDRTLLRWSERADDFSPVFALLVADFHEIERRQFDSEGGFASGGWLPLADSTVAERERLGIGGDSPILDRSGAGTYGSSHREGGTLRRELTESSAQGAVELITPGEMFVGTDDPVAGYHQRGHERPTPLPRRRPVEFREMDRLRWTKAIQAWITTGDATTVMSGPLGL